MQSQDRRLPSDDDIESSVLEKLLYHEERWEDEDIDPYVEIDDLIEVVANDTHAKIDPELSRELEHRTKAVLAKLESKGLVSHLVSECWYITDEGMQDQQNR